MTSAFCSVENAIARIAKGQMVIVVDDETRENEGDLVVSAQTVTADDIHFMSTYGRGLICMPMTREAFKRLDISMMVQNNESSYQTAFGVSIGAKEGITTGISAEDRAKTIRVAQAPNTTPADIVKPGHVFPLCAKEHGVLERVGHTEASVDLMKLAGLSPAAVICEISSDDGHMARMPELKTFAKTHDIPIISIADLVQYRLTHESVFDHVSSAHIPVETGSTWTMHVFASRIDGHEVVAMMPPKVNAGSRAPLVRVHSECLTGDVFGSRRCDCGWQLNRSMALIEREGGALIYLKQEGRGIGLGNKIKAYALQEAGMDTVEANHALGFEADLRGYQDAAQVLKALDISRLRLLTNNPKKAQDLESYAIEVVSTEAIESPLHQHNKQYLKTKKEKLGHTLTLKESSNDQTCDRLC